MTVVRIGEQRQPKRSSLLLRRVTPGMLLLTLGAIVVLRLWVVATAIVEGHSMEDTLLPGDRVLIVKPLTPKRFDVVVLREPYEGGIDIKRVVGLPGDVISMVPFRMNAGSQEVLLGSQLYVNGVPYDEPYATSMVPSSLPPFRVPKDSLFVLGDNRDVSIDSRRYGPVAGKYIQGVGVARVFPLRRAGVMPRHATATGAVPAAISQ